jgi:hypothetical protein
MGAFLFLKLPGFRPSLRTPALVGSLSAEGGKQSNFLRPPSETIF